MGAAVWALTVWATGHKGAGTNRCRRFGAGRFGATVTLRSGRCCDVCPRAHCSANATWSSL